MPEPPDKSSAGFSREGLSFSPPDRPAGTDKSAANAGAAVPVKPAGTVKPPQNARSKPAASQPRRSGTQAPRQPERRSVLPKGYGTASGTDSASKPNAEHIPAARPAAAGESAPAVTPDTAVFRRVQMPAEKPEKKNKKKPVFKVTMRRRPRAFTGLLAGILYVIVVLTLSVVLGSAGWSFVRDVLALQKEPVTTTIEYTGDMSITELANLLKSKGVIEYEWLFRLYCDISHAEEKMAPGKYIIQAEDYRALVNMMTPYSESRAEVTITFPEGVTMERIFQLLEENEVAGRKELEEAAATINWRHDYLNNLPAVPGRMEGYLFPETYTFYVNESPTSALQKFVREFDRRLTAEMRKHVEESGYTLHEIITIASLIEAESGADMQERKNIASVIYNRLEKWNPPLLQIDASLLYYMGGRREITKEDMEADNPYNTRKYPGLPPGPICSPSIDSIRAALYPNKTQYYFYLLDDEDVTQFCKTQAEFEQKMASYERYR